jgi:adenylate cyclase
MAMAAISVSRPLNRVRTSLREVEMGDLGVRLPVDDLGELGRLAEGVNSLVAGLREREELRDLFAKQVGLDSLAQLAAGEGFGTPGEHRRVTVLFVDLRGYTRYSETHSPAEVVELLNQFFRVVVAVVHRCGGWVNKFEGDSAMCLFGAPNQDPDPAGAALRAAAALPRELERVPTLLPSGIGVATGDVIAGFVGTPERFEYTVIGDCVNLASRLCELAKEERSGVLASALTVESAGLPLAWVPSGRKRIRGRAERALTYSLAAPRRRRSM